MAASAPPALANASKPFAPIWRPDKLQPRRSCDATVRGRFGMVARIPTQGVFTLMACILAAPWTGGQEIPTQTMRPVIRGREAAVSSMKAEATEAARRILAEGGNAFDAIVGGQAALAVADFPLNGVGSDAEVLVYVARERKIWSIN